MSYKDDKEVEALVHQLKEVTLKYEKLHAQVVRLMEKYAGRSENMPQPAYDRYRELAARRDEAYSEMTALERRLFEDE